LDNSIRTNSQNSRTPSPVSLGSVRALRSASAPLRSPTSFVHGSCLFRLVLAVMLPKPGIPNAELELSDGGRVVSWMRVSSAGREGYRAKRRWNVSRWSRRMLKGSSSAGSFRAGSGVVEDGSGLGGSGGWFSLCSLLQATEQLREAC
jgi:hypothetical protein